MGCICIKNVERFPWDSIEPFGEYELRLFEIYKKLYEESLFNYQGIPISMKHYPPDYGKLSGFYHLVYNNYEKTGRDKDKLPHLERLEKFTWGRRIIDFNDEEICDSLLIFENKRKKENNICIYSECLDFIVILSRRNGFLLLKTAYPINNINTRRDIYREYREHKDKVEKLKTPMRNA